MKSGFSLIELLISIFILLSITSVVMAVFVAGLRGSTRSSIEIEVRQNGQLALAQMSRMIRSSKSFDGLSTDGTRPASFSCVAAGIGVSAPTPTPIRYAAAHVTGFDGGLTDIVCPLNGAETAVSSKSAGIASSLIDTTRVVTDSSTCYFTCYQAFATDVPTIGVFLSLQSKQAVGVGTYSQDFQTTIVPRNFIR